MRVLLVEDSPGDARLVALELARVSPDFSVVHVPKLSEALARLRLKDSDVVLADLGLPDSFGLRTAQKLVEAAGDVPVIVLTGVDDEALGLQALQHGAQDFLVKGRADGRALARAIRYARERQQARAAAGPDAGSRALLERVLESTTEGLVVVDARGIVRLANPAAARLLETREASLVGSRFPRELPRSPDGVVETRIGLPDGRSRLVEIRVTLADWEGFPASLVTLTDLADRERADAAEKRLAGNPVAPGPLLVLVVEPDDGARAGMAETLATAGCRALVARDGSEAVTLARGNDVAVVVTDVAFPDIGAVEFMRRIRDARPAARMLLCSFHPKEDLVRRGLLEPEGAYLRRPFAPGDLARAVHEAATGPSGAF